VKERGIAWAVEQTRRVIHGPAYLTFDIDSVDPIRAKAR
jgi:arginase family enzyme